jgi:topoisomerase IV subunit A
LKYQFTEKQAEAIVMLQLYRLTNTDIIELVEQTKNFKLIIASLEDILSNEDKLKEVMKDELRKIKKEYGNPRKSEIKADITEIKIDNTQMIPKEDAVVVVTNEGYVKRVSLRSYNANEETLVKEKDYVIGLFNLNTLDTLLLFTDKGNYLYVPVYELPDLKWKELGKHVSNIIKIDAEENIISAIPVSNFDEEIQITMFTKNGMIKRSLLSEFKCQRYSKPLMAIKLKDKDKLISSILSNDQDVFISTNNGYGIWFDINEVPSTGLKTSGVKAINLKK